MPLPLAFVNFCMRLHKSSPHNELFGPLGFFITCLFCSCGTSVAQPPGLCRQRGRCACSTANRSRASTFLSSLWARKGLIFSFVIFPEHLGTGPYGQLLGLGSLKNEKKIKLRDFEASTCDFGTRLWAFQ